MANDATIQKALARKRELEAELREINVFIELYRKYSGNDGLSASVETDGALPSQPTHGSNGAGESKSKDRSRGMSQGDFEALARDIMLERGVPLSLEAVLDGFHAKGRGLGGTNEMGNLKTKMWRATAESKSIKRIPGAGLWPRDIPCPAVSYVPEIASGVSK